MKKLPNLVSWIHALAWFQIVTGFIFLLLVFNFVEGGFSFPISAEYEKQFVEIFGTDGEFGKEEGGRYMAMILVSMIGSALVLVAIRMRTLLWWRIAAFGLVFQVLVSLHLGSLPLLSLIVLMLLTFPSVRAFFVAEKKA